LKRTDRSPQLPDNWRITAALFEPRHPSATFEYDFLLDHSPLPRPWSEFSEVSCQGIRVFASLRIEVIPFGPSRDTRSESRRVSGEAASNVLNL
jgi:hypothetical protein